MNKKNTEYLFNKYKDIFADKDNMSFFECDDGWLSLIDCLCNLIMCHCNNEKINPPLAIQVKEKLGGLRFYINNCQDTTIYNYIMFAEEMSFHICEICGTTNNVSTLDKGRITTLCDKCRTN